VSKVEAVRGVVAREQRRVVVKQLQKRSKEYREIGPFLDKATDNLRKGLIALKENASVVGRDHRHVQTLHRDWRAGGFGYRAFRLRRVGNPSRGLTP
jgi:hypothetical protein